MPDPTKTLLDPETITRAEALGMHARMIVEGFMAGEHKSPFRGFAIEFTQHREYVPGDDLRHLDWKVLGRTDRYYLKQYEQETNYVGHILIDGSESMKYGSNPTGASNKGQGARGRKIDYARQLAACMAYLILLQRDATSVSVFDSKVQSHIPRTGNLASIHNIMAALAAFEPSSTTAIGSVLHNVAGQIKCKGIVVLISDLFDDEQAILEGIQHLRFGGNEVIVFHTLDPYELEFPFKGMVEFEGLESVDRRTTRPAEIRKSYLRELQQFQTRLREGCERNQSHYVLVNTAHPLVEVLTGYLVFRQRTIHL